VSGDGRRKEERNASTEREGESPASIESMGRSEPREDCNIYSPLSSVFCSLPLIDSKGTWTETREKRREGKEISQS